jgi:hypothetical protein
VIPTCGRNIADEGETDAYTGRTVAVIQDEVVPCLFTVRTELACPEPLLKHKKIVFVSTTLCDPSLCLSSLSFRALCYSNTEVPDFSRSKAEAALARRAAR